MDSHPSVSKTLLLLLVIINSAHLDAGNQSTAPAERRRSLNSSPFDSSRYHFDPQTPGGVLTGGTQATVRLAPCPLGLAGSDKDHYVYISGGSSRTVDISTATNAAPVTIVTKSPIAPVTGNLALINGADNPRINGPWKITAVNRTTFTLDNSRTGFAIVSATNTAPIAITTRPPNQDHGWQTGDTVTITGVRGNTAANGTFTVTRISGHEFSLDNSIGNGLHINSAGLAQGVYSSPGAVTIGPEAVLIAGGTCSPGAASGTIIFTPANAHRGAWNIRSATAGIQEAINAARAAGATHVYIPGSSRPHQIYATITVPRNFLLEGAGAGTVLKLNPALPAVAGLRVAGTGGPSTTSATPLSFADRANIRTSTIVLTSPAGFSPGDLVCINSGTEPGYGNTFVQMNTIAAISGSLVTFHNPIVIPIGITLNNSITKVIPATGVTIRYLALDGSSIGADRNGADIGIFGMVLSNLSNSVIDHIWFRNFTADGALSSFNGYGNYFTDLYDTNSGTDGIFGLAFGGQTNSQIHRITSINSSGFAVGLVASTNLNVSGITVMNAADRGIKLNAVAWSNLIDLVIHNSGFTGYAITQGTYQTQTRGIISSSNKASEGIWFSSQDNQHNLIDGVTVNGNAGLGVVIYNNDHHNVVRNISGGDSFDDVGTNNTMTPAMQFRSFAYNSLDQPIPTDMETPLTFDLNAYDTGGVHSVVADISRFTVPATDATFHPVAQYLLAAQVRFAQNNTGTRVLSAWKNGNTRLCRQTGVPARSDDHYLSLSCTVVLNAGDFIEFKVFQDTAGILNAVSGVNSTFGSVVRLQ